MGFGGGGGGACCTGGAVTPFGIPVTAGWPWGAPIAPFATGVAGRCFTSSTGLPRTEGLGDATDTLPPFSSGVAAVLEAVVRRTIAALPGASPFWEAPD